MTPVIQPQLPLDAQVTVAEQSLIFTRAYQAALATGVDLLEILDACWED